MPDGFHERDNQKRNVQQLAFAAQEKEFGSYRLAREDCSQYRHAGDAGLPLFELMDRVKDAWDSGVGFIKKELGDKAGVPVHNLPDLVIGNDGHSSKSRN